MKIINSSNISMFYFFKRIINFKLHLTKYKQFELKKNVRFCKQKQ